MAEHSSVNRRVVGSSPTRGVWRSSQAVRQWSATPVRTGSNPVCASGKLLMNQELFYCRKSEKTKKQEMMRSMWSVISCFFVFTGVIEQEAVFLFVSESILQNSRLHGWCGSPPENRFLLVNSLLLSWIWFSEAESRYWLQSRVVFSSVRSFGE